MISPFRNRSDEIDQLTTALAKVQAELKNPVPNRVSHFAKRGKDGTAQPDYADLDAVEDLIRKPCGKYDISHDCELEMIGDIPCLRLVVAHGESGQWRSSYIHMSPQLRPQEFLATLTYYRRCLLCAFFGIAADRDDDGTTAEAAHARNAAELASRTKKAMEKAWAKCESDEDRDNWKERAKKPLAEGIVTQEWVDELTASKP